MVLNMIRYNQDQEILWVEDENNLMELTLNTLLSIKKGSLHLSTNPVEFREKGSRFWENNLKSINKDLSTAILFTKRKSMDNDNKFLKVNSKIKAIPLLVLTGPSKDMKDIMKELTGNAGCFKERVNFSKFLKKMRAFPMYWASIDTTGQHKENRCFP